MYMCVCLFLHLLEKRLALETQVDIIPVYIFGNTRLYDHGLTYDSVITRFSRRFKISILYFWGPYFLPFPYRTPISVVFAEPISGIPPRLPPHVLTLFNYIGFCIIY